MSVRFHFAVSCILIINDFEEVPPPGFKRLISGGEVRLRGAYVIKCEDIIKDESGNIIELHCTHDAATLAARPEGRKVKGVIHWVPAAEAIDAEIRLYDRLFTHENPDSAEGDYRDFINPDCKQVLCGCKLEPSLGTAAPEARFQFEREGYFVADREDHSQATPVFNLTVGLRDTWGKAQQRNS